MNEIMWVVAGIAIGVFGILLWALIEINLNQTKDEEKREMFEEMYRYVEARISRDVITAIDARLQSRPTKEADDESDI